MNYGVVFEETPDGIGAYLPDIDGVAVVGSSKPEALEMLDKALQWHFDGLLEDGLPFPTPSSDPSRYEWMVCPQRAYLVRIEAGAEFLTVSDGAAAGPVPQLWPLRDESTSQPLQLVREPSAAS